MTDLLTLSRRVSEADGPSRELDVATGIATRKFFVSDKLDGWGNPLIGRIDRDGSICTPGNGGPDALVPHYTASLDAVAALIAERLPGFKWSLHKSESPYVAGVTKEAPVRTMPHMGVAKTPALALLSAALLAIHERKEP